MIREDGDSEGTEEIDDDPEGSASNGRRPWEKIIKVKMTKWEEEG